MTNFFEVLLEVLKADKRFFTDDGTLLRNKVYESALNMDAELIGLILDNPETKRRFFTEVKGTLVFDKIAFGWVVNNRQFLPDSYTQFKNRIGLTNSQGDLISASNDVVLSFPYKDCILEGGQSHDDQKRNEVFYNATLAPDEVDRLLYPKVLVGARHYSYSGSYDLFGNPNPSAGINHEIFEAKEYSDNDNLVIKGNNLCAISSLLKRYEGTIKCILIDPPYNTGNDSFGYNDRFNHSTWLVFMKNRLELAYRLLSQDGSIAIYIDNKEVGYLLTLLDEVFGREQKGSIITVKRGSVTGHKAINPGVVNVTDYILVYAKNKALWKPNKVYRKRPRNSRYDTFIKNRDKSKDEWEFCSLLDAFSDYKGISKREIRNLGSFEPDIYQFVIDNANAVVQFAYPDIDKVSQETKELIRLSQQNPDQVFIQTRETELDIVLKNGKRLLFYKDRLMEIDGELVTAELVTDIWEDVLPNDLAGEGNVTFKKGKKPEKAIKRVLELFTDVNEVVLDFFAGSGSTLAVAHKMKRRYIGVEQMDYIDDALVKRLTDVIDGNEKKGVTKVMGWQGGGSFVYCELAKCNQYFFDSVASAKTDADLTVLLNHILNTGFINSKVDPAEIGHAANDFEALSFEDKKHFILELLDKNMLYVNLCDIDDEEYAISDADKAFTRSFYGLEGDRV
jgi:adenine-specific DNA-methyltransferase